MKKELDALKQQNEKIYKQNADEVDGRSSLKVNGQVRVKRRRRSSVGLNRTCYTCNKTIEYSISADESESGAIHDSPTKCIPESASWNGTVSDKTNCKHHSMKKKHLFLHSKSSPNLFNKCSRVLKGTAEYNSLNVKRPSIIKDIPDINVTDVSEAEKTDTETNTLNVLQNILALESDTGLSEMSDNSDKSNDTSDEEIGL